MSIIEGMVYIMLTMAFSGAIVDSSDAKGSAEFCFMCVKVGHEYGETEGNLEFIPEVVVARKPILERKQ